MTIAMMADSSIKTALTAFINQAGEDLDQFKRSLTSWFNDVMDHASGWYKRSTQKILVVIAAILCVVNNVDTVDLVRHLSADPKLRASALAAALDATNEGRDTLQKRCPRPTSTRCWKVQISRFGGRKTVCVSSGRI